MIVANKGKIKTMAENLSESGAGRSLWKDARMRFMQNKAATISLIYFTFYCSYSLLLDLTLLFGVMNKLIGMLWVQLQELECPQLKVGTSLGQMTWAEIFTQE